MEQPWLARTALLLGEKAMGRLSSLRVAVMGLGGVGGAAAEMLCRSGIGHMLVADNDTVDITNINRQLIADTNTVGMKKIEAARQRLMAINPKLDLVCSDSFYLPGSGDFLYDYQPDFIVDAIDTVTAKLDIAENCLRFGISSISCLGTGNRIDPAALRVGDILDTTGCGCPLARVMRRELKKRGIQHSVVLYSTELPRNIIAESSGGRHSPASISFVPATAGCLLAAYVVRQAIGWE